MIILKRTIPRRTFLRGMGAAVALPLLDSMVPAFASTLDASGKPPVRMSFVYVPNGIIMDKWTPAAEGAGYQLTPILEPLAPFRDRFLLLSGIDGVMGGHAGGCGSYLTGIIPKESLFDLQSGTSVDQIAAKEVGKKTRLASLELTLENAAEIVGDGDGNFSAAYTKTISWRTPTTPVPMEDHPRAVFERLFGDSESTDPAQRLARMQKDRSILDSVMEDLTRLLTGLGPNDRAKLAEYVDAIRDIERRIQVAEEQGSQELPLMQRPGDVPVSYEDYAKLMFDLQAIAFQCDITRVTTLMMAREKSNRAYREIGIAEPHHPMSHHKDDAQKIADLIKINTYHVKLFAHFLDKLRSTPDGDGSLLDHAVILYGASLGDGNKHVPTNLPFVLAGGAAGQIKGGRHVRYPKETPTANLYLTLLDMIGAPVEKFANSSGKLQTLSVA